MLLLLGVGNKAKGLGKEGRAKAKKKQTAPEGARALVRGRAH
jgi:hypothetical protein